MTHQRADGQAEAAATNPPLPGVPLQVRNAPTKLMKQLGYGKEYSYNPDFAHPVYNVSHSYDFRQVGLPSDLSGIFAA